MSAETQARKIFETWEKTLPMSHVFTGLHNEVDLLVKMIAAALEQRSKEAITNRTIYEG